MEQDALEVTKGEAAPARTHWTGQPSNVPARTMRGERNTLIFLSIYLVAFPVAMASLNELGLHGLAAAAVAYALMMVMAFVQIGLRRSATIADDRDLVLLDEHVDQNELLVDVTIVQERVVTGKDRGVLVVDDDRMVFSGHQSAFCLGRQDVAHLRKGDYPFPLLGLSVLAEDRRVQLMFTPVPTPAESRVGQRKLRDLLRHFMESTKVFDGKRAYPPLSVGPQASDHPNRTGRAFGSILALMLALAITITAVVNGVDTLAVFLAILLILDLLALYVAERKQRRRKKLFAELDTRYGSLELPDSE